MQRYPGAQPFTTEQRHIFFGRDNDLEEVHQLVQLEELVVLYGKSGLGKSSLLNAGLIPRLVESEQFQPLTIRFGAWTEEAEASPLQRSKQGLLQDVEGETFLEKIIPEEASLWSVVKTRQLLRGGSHLVLIFDQFEELFTYPEEQVQAFKQELTELLKTTIPRRYRQMLDVLPEDVLSPEEEAQLYEPLDTKAVLAIRSDRMHLLDKLSDFLPNILRNNYELSALDTEQARAAIVRPAKEKQEKDGKKIYTTPAFTYSNAALDTILDFLKDEAGRIESYALQIVCSDFERKVDEQKLTRLSAADLGDMEAIIADYYHTRLAALGDEDDIKRTRHLIEDGLLLEEEETRLTLHEGQIAALFNVPPKLLTRLVDVGLLRSEPSLRGGYTYELPHDTLIAPVLKAKRQRKAEEARLQREQQEQARLAELAELRRKRRRAILLAIAGFVLAAVAVVAFIIARRQSALAKAAQTEAEKAQLEAENNYKEFLLQQRNNNRLEAQRLINEGDIFYQAEAYDDAQQRYQTAIDRLQPRAEEADMDIQLERTDSLIIREAKRKLDLF